MGTDYPNTVKYKEAMSVSSPIIPPFDAIRAAIERHQTFYITTHVGPDGDAIGPALALKTALENLGKTVTYVSRDGVPQSSQFVARADQVLLSGARRRALRLRVRARLRWHARARGFGLRAD